MAPKSMTKTEMEQLYRRFNRRRFVHPDPIEFLYRYDSAADREVVGLIAASLAYGRVGQILKSVGRVLEQLASPADFIATASRAALEERFRELKHRFTDGRQMAALLFAAGRIIDTCGSLQACFLQGVNRRDATVQPALKPFADALRAHGPCGSLIPNPAEGSACKRLNLYLRWMVRRDAVDPGGWQGISRSQLIVPLDTHLLRAAQSLGLTARKSADMRTALEVTMALRAYSPRDPVKYDFALTREGILGTHARLR